MNYSLGNMLGGGMIGGLDPSAKGYIAAVTAAGATVTSSQRTFINNFYKSAKADYYTNLKRLYLPIWGVAAANAIDMITLASGTFVGGVTHGAGFIQGNGTTGYFTTGTASNTLYTTESGMIGTLNYTAIPSANMTVAASGGATFATSARCASGGSGTVQAAGWLGAPVTRAASSTSAILLTARLSGVTIAARRNTAGYTEDTLTAATLASLTSDNSVFLTATPVLGFTSNQVGAAFIANGVSLSTRQNFTLHLKNLWEGCTGLTLP